MGFSSKLIFIKSLPDSELPVALERHKHALSPHTSESWRDGAFDLSGLSYESLVSTSLIFALFYVPHGGPSSDCQFSLQDFYLGAVYLI
jgi:hypothetical protein